MIEDIEEEDDENGDEGSYLESMSEYRPVGLLQSGLDGEMTAWLTDPLIFNFLIDDDHLPDTDITDHMTLIIDIGLLHERNDKTKDKETKQDERNNIFENEYPYGE